MSFKVQFTGDLDWPISYKDDVVPILCKAKGFRIDRCSLSTFHKTREAVDGFWVDAPSAVTDSNGIVTFS